MSAPPSWQELHFTAKKEQVAALEAWLFECGALSVTLEDDADQPLLEPGPGETPLWEAVSVTALFDGDRALHSVIDAVPRHLVVTSDAQPVPVADREWIRVWEDQFHPMQLGQRLWVCPSWTAPPDPAAVNILLDPGLAFGTGTHPTTAMCLSAIDACVLHPLRVVDYGCGSGILGIAAARLGAGPVLAIDNDPQALVASRANAQANAVAEAQFAVVMPDDSAVTQWSGTAELVVANILAGPLVTLAPTLLSLLAPGGQLLLAGLLKDQASEVIDAYANQVPLQIAAQEDGWVLLSGQRAV
ncbi:50S ribosomal protein L11 methyltransferase [Luminiphilus sp.]|nr:50S ribosomal protein L11 methyltransferase [Luminiphilus sp.]